MKNLLEYVDHETYLRIKCERCKLSGAITNYISFIGCTCSETINNIFSDLQETDTECCSEEVLPDDVLPDTIQDQDVDLQACPELSGQIIGGRPSSVNRHPYQVSMVLNGNSFCGGFIISRDYVLTAAHCVQK